MEPYSSTSRGPLGGARDHKFKGRRSTEAKNKRPLAADAKDSRSKDATITVQIRRPCCRLSSLEQKKKSLSFAHSFTASPATATPATATPAWVDAERTRRMFLLAEIQSHELWLKKLGLFSSFAAEGDCKKKTDKAKKTQRSRCCLVSKDTTHDDNLPSNNVARSDSVDAVSPRQLYLTWNMTLPVCCQGGDLYVRILSEMHQRGLLSEADSVGLASLSVLVASEHQSTTSRKLPIVGVATLSRHAANKADMPRLEEHAWASSREEHACASSQVAPPVLPQTETSNNKEVFKDDAVVLYQSSVLEIVFKF